MPVEKRENRINSVSDVVKQYQKHYGINHRRQSVLFSNGRLAHIMRLLGSALLPDLAEKRVGEYVQSRLKERAGGRRISMELGELSRVVGKKWSVLWPKVRKLEERKDAGRALSRGGKEVARRRTACAFALHRYLCTSGAAHWDEVR
jgi:hypothetical protein